MNRITLTLFAIVAFTFAALANEAPVAAQEALTQKFPKAEEITWMKESANNFRAEFIISGVKMWANFNEDGKWISTQTTVPLSKLPDPVTNFVKKNYAGGEILGITKIERATLEVLYEMKVKTVTGINKVRVTENGIAAK